MIGKLTGILDVLAEDHVILDVGGVGYRVFVSHRALSTMGKTGENCRLFVETHMREDAIRLFGFMTEQERDWFRLLQQVQGVGAKVALAILGTLTVTEIADAIALRDATFLTRAPGIGKKVAERMITELKGKAPPVANIGEDGAASALAGVAQAMAGEGASAVGDAISALGNLGYGRDQAALAVALAMKQAGEEASSANLIRLALQALSKM